MKEETKIKLAESLTSYTTDIIPYLPYLLQDFWELGSSPKDILSLFKKHIPMSNQFKVLDLGCGKGAVAIHLAKELNVSVKGIDLMPEFIGEAKEKAEEFGVAELCDFEVGDINEQLNLNRNYDVVIWGAVGDILGNRKETLKKLMSTVKKGGYILIEDAYLSDEGLQNQLRFEQDCPTYEEWNKLFRESNLKTIECLLASNNSTVDYNEELNWIITRANELIEKYPDKKEMFEQYVENQKGEYEDLESDIVGFTWLLQSL